MKAGMTAGIFACVFGIIGILSLGFIFVPLGFVVALVGTIGALRSRDAASIGVNVLAWVLLVIGFVTSPVLLMGIVTILGLIGIGTGYIQP